MSGADPIYHFEIIGHMMAYGLNAPQTSTIFWAIFGYGQLLNLFFGSSQNGKLVAEICLF
jgi:hypothetical protein